MIDTNDYDLISYKSHDQNLILSAQYYQCAEKNAPVLLLMHGLTRNAKDFAPLVAHLKQTYQLIIPDQRGRGLSDYDLDPNSYHIGNYVADMFGLLDHLGCERVHIIGTSMGGLMAMVMASLAPQRIGALVLNDVGPKLELLGLERISNYIGRHTRYDSLDDLVSAMQKTHASAFVDFGFDDWRDFALRTHKVTDEGDWVADYDPMIKITFDTALKLAKESPSDLWPLWEKLSAHRVLAIRGALSDLLSDETLSQMTQSHPYCETVTIKNRGHAPLLNEDDVLAALLPFLSRTTSQDQP